MRTRCLCLCWVVMVGLVLVGAGCKGKAESEVPVGLIVKSSTSGVIVIADEAGDKQEMATKVLREHVRQMIGLDLTVQTVTQYKGRSVPADVAFLVGQSQLTEAIGVAVEQNADAGDHYVIKTDAAAGNVALVGNDAGNLRGTVYAVYDLLWRLGCGWYGPDPLWQVIPEKGELVIGSLDIDEQPAFAMRDIWLVGDRRLRSAWRLGGASVSHGHALIRMAERDKYQAEHPDWYGPGQPSMTHPELIKLVADNCRKLIDQRPGKIVSISLCANDHGGYAERDRWAGNISSQTLYFINAVAKELAKTHPNRYLLTTYAYWYAHGAPEPARKAEPGVCIMQVNEGNHLKPWDYPESQEVYESNGRSNTREVKAFEAWKATGAELAIYEWWIPGCGDNNWRLAPWYPLETALRNYRYWLKGGVRYISHESSAGFERGNGFPLRWPLYYVGARAMWNPELSVEQILRPACQQLFGPAAEQMYAYYRVFEKATMASELTGENWRLPSPELIYTPEYETEATRLIESALAATEDPTILARIEQERKNWQEATQMLARLRAEPQIFYQVYCDGRRMRIREKMMKANVISDLFGFAEHIPVSVLESDGRYRLLDPEESIDLSAHNQFRTGNSE